jgi:hypothetical protein
MNPEDAVARQAMIARMSGSPMPVASQMSSQAPVAAPSSPVMNPPGPVRPPQLQLGDVQHKATPTDSDNLAKALLPGTAHLDPHVQAMSKALLQQLIPYLGAGQASPRVP